MKKLLTFIIMLLCTFFAHTQEVKKVAILEIVDKSGTISYGTKLQVRGNLTYAISNTSGFEGYDRVDLASIIDEHDFQRTGLVSDDQIKQLGKLTGAQYVLIAEVAPLAEKEIMITAKVLNVETAGIIKAGLPVYAETTSKDIQSACINLAKSLFGMEFMQTQSRIEQEEQQREQTRIAEEQRIAEEEQRLSEEDALRKQAAIDKANLMGALFGQTASPEGAGGMGESVSLAAKGNPLGHGNSGGNSWSLNGRSVVGALPTPGNDFKAEGKVVVNITVNANGKVINAVVGPGTTVTDYTTQQLAIRAALKAKFNSVNRPDNAIGTITYNFKFK